MLRAIHCDTQGHIFRHLTSLEQASEVKKIPDSLLWLDLQSPNEQELTKLGKEFNLHPLAIEDASREHQRPKVDEYESFYFVVFYSANFNTTAQELDICELDMFLGKNYLITVHNEHIHELDEVEQRWTHNAKQLEWGVGVLLYTLLDTIVDRYFPVIDELVNQAEELEDRLFTGVVRQTSFTQELLELRKHFLTLRRIATPERDVLNTLTNRDNPIFDEHALIYFRDVYDHITRLADTIDLYRDQISTTMDANLSIVSNDLNKVMRTLTAASIILMADSLLAGIWGMNFVNIPELRLQFGYYGALVLMVVISLLLLLFFKRLKWF
ncbi:MAG TPA: magnesium/cobalt transporter CorA [Ktedonobacteraceae bacterium]|nr:magnesium/cobalt transporter CorA [Ktedonobacteraceae bacterium]